MQSQSDDDSWEGRCGRAADDLEAHRQLEAAKIELRDHLVVEGIDTGRTVDAVSRVARIAPSRVHQILTKRG